MKARRCENEIRKNAQIWQKNIFKKEKKNDSRPIPKLENPIPSPNIPDPSLPKDNLYFTCDGHLTLSLRKCTLA